MHHAWSTSKLPIILTAFIDKPWHGPFILFISPSNSLHCEQQIPFPWGGDIQ